MIHINEVDTGGFEISFKYQPWIVTAVKQIAGARFNGAYKHWEVPASSRDQLFQWAKTIGFDQQVVKHAIDPMPELTIDIPLKMEMFPYQKQGTAYNLLKKRVIVGDQPGLGKTVQAIATMEGAGLKCILVICPATLKQNWKNEIEKKWTHRKAIILSDKVKTAWVTYYKVGMANYFIVNYESLKKFFVQEITVSHDKDGNKLPMTLKNVVFRDTINLFDGIILDESHRCRDTKTQQTKFTRGLTKGKEWVLALTGTPVVNQPKDLISQLGIIDRLGDMGGYKRFTERYCSGANNASNLKELNYLLNQTCFYRREKKDVLKDLPPKMRNIVSIDITNRDEYNKAEQNLILYLRENLQKSEGEITTALRGEAMVMIGILKKISARGKVEQVIEHIREIVESGEKIVVFAWHTDVVAALHEAIPQSMTLTGGTSIADREKNINAFQNDRNAQVIICNIKTGGVGITLTASSRVLFIELPWHPADCEQCEDRCHRIGTKDSVECTYCLGSNTIDERIYEIIERKRGIVNQVTGSEEEIETTMVTELISLYVEKSG